MKHLFRFWNGLVPLLLGMVVLAALFSVLYGAGTLIEHYGWLGVVFDGAIFFACFAYFLGWVAEAPGLHGEY